MRLLSEFIQLPLTFDAALLATEVAQFDERDWRPHPEGHPGNSALPLIAVHGDPANDDVRGPMRPTRYLERCPYLRQVLAAFHAVWGRTRLMRLDGNAEATAHTDTNYYWSQHTRVHVPIVTDDDVRFICGETSVHMRAGEAWIFDTWRKHNVLNPNPTRRIHLVADTIGSAAFWELVDRAGATPRHVPYDPLRAARLATENFNHPVVMPPSEQSELIALLDGLLERAVRTFHRDWRAAYARFGENREGLPLYRQLLKRLTAELEPLRGQHRLGNGVDAVEAAHSLLIRPALGEIVKPARRIERPIFIVCSPRSGSSLFFETLAQSPSLFTVGGESHRVIEGIPALHPESRRFHSNRLTAADATPEIAAQLEQRFAASLRDRDGRQPPRGATGLRMLEKTPKNSLRVPFLAAAFPDALFVYLYRDMRDTISSMLDAWRSGKFVTYPQLPDWDGPPWSLLLTPGWRELSGKPLAEIVAAQWSAATRYLLDDLEQLPPDRWCIASYDALLENPQREMERLSRFLGIEWDRVLASPLPPSRTTLTAPDPDKWRKNAADLDVALPLVREVAQRARSLFARPPVNPDFRSVFTPSFHEILQKTGGSLAVSTYQSGRLIMIRSIDGQLNTHFSAFASPMGIAVAPDSLAVGTKNQVWRFRHHDALSAFAPTASHNTGDIRVHELAWAGDSLVIVNARFSCLCTLDPNHSFKPLWRPKFVSELTPEDRCHLNGVAIVDGRPRFVTALGATNVKEGWRDAKTRGGVVVDIDSDEIVARELSMPHSPRWHEGRLWFLESGEGRLCALDASGRVNVVAEVPGFARGLAFAGPYAFIGLSQVREHVFDGVPIAARSERQCGIWIVDTRDGSIAGFLRFEGIVQEIFDVQLLHGITRPELIEPDDAKLQTAFLLP
jgi:uncharacterized protein (TIGR03032 family)